MKFSHSLYPDGADEAPLVRTLTNLSGYLLLIQLHQLQWGTHRFRHALPYRATAD